MDTNKYYNLLNKAISTKKPVRYICVLLLIIWGGVLVVELSKDILEVDFFTLVGVFLMFCFYFYKVVVESILECIDVSFDRIVKFEGEIISYESYHGYRTGHVRGNSCIIKINGKKKRLYMYAPLVDYIKQTNKGKWTNNINKKDGIVTGAYLKYSKVLVEFHE